jgi:hypothetical protein
MMVIQDIHLPWVVAMQRLKEQAAQFALDMAAMKKSMEEHCAEERAKLTQTLEEHCAEERAALAQSLAADAAAGLDKEAKHHAAELQALDKKLRDEHAKLLPGA